MFRIPDHTFILTPADFELNQQQFNFLALKSVCTINAGLPRFHDIEQQKLSKTHSLRVHFNIPCLHSIITSPS